MSPIAVFCIDKLSIANIFFFFYVIMFKVKNSQEAFQKHLSVLPILYKGIEEVTKVVAYQLGKPSNKN